MCPSRSRSGLIHFYISQATHDFAKFLPQTDSSIHSFLMFLSLIEVFRAIKKFTLLFLLFRQPLAHMIMVWTWSCLPKISITRHEHRHPSAKCTPILFPFLFVLSHEKSNWPEFIEVAGKSLLYTWCANSRLIKSLTQRRERTWTYYRMEHSTQIPKSLSGPHLGQAKVPWPSFSRLMEKTPKTERHWCSSNYRVIWLELQ